MAELLKKSVIFSTATDTNLSECDAYTSDNYKILRGREICYIIFLA